VTESLIYGVYTKIMSILVILFVYLLLVILSILVIMGNKITYELERKRVCLVECHFPCEINNNDLYLYVRGEDNGP